MLPNEWPATVNRQQFEEACKGVLQERERQTLEDDPLRLGEIWSGWTWKEHPRFPGFGYLHRAVALSARADAAVSVAEVASNMDAEIPDIPEIPDDPASSEPHPSGSRLMVEEHIVYSPTFQVPAFYFTASDESGAPLSLNSIIRSPLFHFPIPLSSLDVQPHKVDLPGSDGSEDAAPVPLLTQGEHPTTGQICWYLHPCETSPAVKELLDHREEPPKGGWELEWLKAWFVVLGRVAYLRSG